MNARRKYRKRTPVVAVQLDLRTKGFTYQKWDATQRCRAGDWIVNSEGDVYTVQKTSFAATYRRHGLGKYLKVTPVWAEVAERGGAIKTKEGKTRYKAGDYLVSNDEAGVDSWAVNAAVFKRTYVAARRRRGRRPAV